MRHTGPSREDFGEESRERAVKEARGCGHKGDFRLMSAYERASGHYAVACDVPDGQFALFDENMKPVSTIKTQIGSIVSDNEADGHKSTLQERAEAYFDANPAFLAALRDAAKVMERRCGKVSARFLMEFARWLRFVGLEGMDELLGCFYGLHVSGDDVAAMPNAYSAYLTRLLEADGVNVTKSRSVMDDA